MILRATIHLKASGTLIAYFAALYGQKYQNHISSPKCPKRRCYSTIFRPTKICRWDLTNSRKSPACRNKPHKTDKKGQASVDACLFFDARPFKQEAPPNSPMCRNAPFIFSISRSRRIKRSLVSQNGLCVAHNILS